MCLSPSTISAAEAAETRDIVRPFPGDGHVDDAVGPSTLALQLLASSTLRDKKVAALSLSSSGVSLSYMIN